MIQQEEQNPSERKTIAIIGAGVAGLSAGIYGQINGFKTTIYEKNPNAGGCCSSWTRKGYTIDNCIHWLTGTNPGTPQNRLWQELGVLDQDSKFAKRDSFYRSRTGNLTLTLWRDPDRTRAELLEASPEDKNEINAFIDCVQFIITLLHSNMTIREILKSIREFDFSSKPMEFGFHFVQYLGMNSVAWSKKFKHPAIQNLILDFMAKEYESYWLMLAYGFFIDSNGDVPVGGSKDMVERLEKKYVSLGGKIIYSKPAKKILIDKKQKSLKIIEKEFLDGKNPSKIMAAHGTAIIFEDGSTESTDYIISACDLHFTYSHLLKFRYAPSALKSFYKNSRKMNRQIYSSFQVAFGVTSLFTEIDDTLAIPTNPIKIANQTYQRITIKNYRNYGKHIAPEGCTVIQVSLPQYIGDFKFWKKLNRKPHNYRTYKKHCAQLILSEILKTFPQYKDKIQILDSWTPISYSEMNNNYFGAYMRYITTPFSFNAFIPQDVKKLDNVFLAGHNLKYPGGLPTAALTGKAAIDKIKKAETLNPPPFIKIPKKVLKQFKKLTQKQQKLFRYSFLPSPTYFFN